MVQIVRSGSGAFGAFGIAVEDLVPRPFKLCYSRRFTPQRAAMHCDHLTIKQACWNTNIAINVHLSRCGEV